MNDRICSLNVLLNLLIGFFFVGVRTSLSAPSEEPGAQWNSELTVGAEAGEDLFEGFGDVLVPVWVGESDLVLLNPRVAATDDDEQELSLGLVYRHLSPKGSVIVGGNVYYDSRWTRHDNHFNQLGLGLEMLTRWVDLRANYYLPESNEGLVDSFSETTVAGYTSTSADWLDPYAEGNAIEQDGTLITKTTSGSLLS